MDYMCIDIYIYNILLFILYLEPVSFSSISGSEKNPKKEGPNSIQNKGHLGSRYICIMYIHIFFYRPEVFHITSAV